MENKLKSNYTVPISACDHTAALSFTGIFNLFMDLATEHAAILGIGNDSLRDKNCFWVAAKSKINIKRRPKMLEQVISSTWPEEPKAIRYNRYYTVEDEKGIIIEGKTEWTILDCVSGRPRKSSDVYPADLEHLTDTVCTEPFTRFNTNFEDCQELCKHTVVSADIDLSQHMNNVAYIRAVLCAFSCEEIVKMNISSVEIAYRLQCYEGEVLSIRRRNTEDGMEIGVIKADGTCGAVLKLA